MPGRRAIVAALHGASERFVRELNAPTDRAPDWNEFEWRAAMAVAVMHGVSGLLAERLRWRGPALWQDFLAEQLRQGVLREQRVRSLLSQLDAAAKKAGIPLMALKGSAILDMGLYAPGVRPQSDIDLLCRPGDEATAARVIESLGYEEGDTSWKHVDFVPTGQGADRIFGEHIGNPHKVELHVRIAERLPRREVQVELLRPNAQAGLNGYVSGGALLKHLLLHAAGNLSVRSGRLIQLHDIALLCRSLRSEALSSAFGTTATPWWAWPALALAERCFPGSVEPSVLGQAAAACPWWLRRQVMARSLEEVSLVDPRILAMPALAWADDFGAALEYAWRQLVPDRESTQLRRTTAPRQAMTAGSSWSVQPQWLRVLRWLLARPLRVLTMYSLRTACSYMPAARP
ncbi:nucleotidyltransferase family protein [Burkholderiaceae bacterium UC74_6]